MKETLLLLFAGVMGLLHGPSNPRAQLCSGSLGDPTIQITFGPSGNTGAGYIPPGYTYTTDPCPNDGFYTITSASAACFGSTWHTVTSDHTGHGNFMLVNASNQPADFFVARLTDLCPATTYEFSSWIMNLLLSPSGIRPNITFTIETPAGVVLNQFNTGDIPVSPQPEWKQYGFYFTTTPGNPDIVLRMRNNAPGGNGNDLALDDISFRPCGPIVQAAIIGNGPVIDLCDGFDQSFDFSATVSNGFSQPEFQWQLSKDSGKSWLDIAGATSFNYQRPAGHAGIYWYRLTVVEGGNQSRPGCRIASNLLQINVHPKPEVNAGPDRVVVRGHSTELAGMVRGEQVQFAWAPPDFLDDPTKLKPTVLPLRDIVYRLDAISSIGCTNSDEVRLKIVADIFIATAFTPNQDGRNDYWQIPYLDPALGASVNVYNRWGQCVYQVEGAPVNWDGRFNNVLQPAGTYIYVVQFRDGSPMRRGTFQLIR